MLIGDVARTTGVTAKTIRFYEAEGLLHPPQRTGGGYRDYDPSVLNRISFIRQAQSAGLTLRQIKEVVALRDDGQIPCKHVAVLVEGRLDQVKARLHELQRTHDELVALRARLAAIDPADCAEEHVCSAVAAR